MSWLSSFMNPQRGYDAAQGQMDNYYNQAQGYQQPYNQMGQQGGAAAQGAMQNLLNPEQMQNQWAQGYQESPYAKQMEQQAQSSGLDAASSMGLMGSSSALQGIQSGRSNIMGADRQKYLDDLMNKYQLGTQTAGNMMNMGANTAGQMGNNAMNQGQNSAGMAYGSKNAQGQMFGNLMGGAAGLFGSALAGPLGGLAANWGAGKLGMPQDYGTKPTHMGQNYGY